MAGTRGETGKFSWGASSEHAAEGDVGGRTSDGAYQTHPQRQGADARAAAASAKEDDQHMTGEQRAALPNGEASEGPKSTSSTELGSDRSCSSDSDSDDDSDSSDDDADGGARTGSERTPLGGALTAEMTILIFDWDDTLLPSTWIRDQGLRLDAECVPTEEQQAQLQCVAKSVAHTLRTAERHGEVVLVTNAESGWIELSCRKFMPSLCPLLERMRTVSARSTFEQQGVASPFDWKYLAFEREVNRFYENAPAGRRRNVISFGDSAHEREALIRVTQGMTNCCTKSVKFVERPEPDQLLKEHQLMSGCIRRVARHTGDLDLCVSCS